MKHIKNKFNITYGDVYSVTYNNETILLVVNFTEEYAVYCCELKGTDRWETKKNGKCILVPNYKSNNISTHKGPITCYPLNIHEMLIYFNHTVLFAYSLDLDGYEKRKKEEKEKYIYFYDEDEKTGLLS